MKLGLRLGCLRSKRAVHAHVCVLGDGCAGSPFLTWQGPPRGRGPRPEPPWGEPAAGQEEAGSRWGSGQEEEPQDKL